MAQARPTTRSSRSSPKCEADDLACWPRPVVGLGMPQEAAYNHSAKLRAVPQRVTA